MSEITCRGSIALGSACMKCSRCKKEYDKKVMAVNDAVLKKHDKLFMKLRIAELEERETLLIETLQKIIDGVDSSLLLDEDLAEAWEDLHKLVVDGRSTLSNLGEGK